MLKMKVKLSFKPLSSNTSYDDVLRAEALITCGMIVLCVSNARLQNKLDPESGVWYGTGKCRHPVGAGRPTGEELGSVTPLEGKGA
uniref:Polyketide synthase n=1 Tax=Peronospora matthiolae TaxID=2874970 RepID=A0AAV1V2N6_9STRA